MAFFLSLTYRFEDINQVYQEISIPLEPDFEKNFAEEIELDTGNF